jgi:hypothetical protein
VARKNPQIHEVDLKNTEQFYGLIEITKADDDVIPIFLKSPDGNLEIISSFSKEFTDIKEGYKLAYLGKKMETPKGEGRKANKKKETEAG